MRCRNDTGKEVLVRFTEKEGMYFWKVVMPGAIIDIPEDYADNLGFTTERNGPIIEEVDSDYVKPIEQAEQVKPVESSIKDTKVETKMVNEKRKRKKHE